MDKRVWQSLSAEMEIGHTNKYVYSWRFGIRLKGIINRQSQNTHEQKIEYVYIDAMRARCLTCANGLSSSPVSTCRARAIRRTGQRVARCAGEHHNGSIRHRRSRLDSIERSRKRCTSDDLERREFTS